MHKSLIALLLLGSASAFAGGAADDQLNRTAFNGDRTRAEVKAELQLAQQQGSVGVHTDYAANLQPAGEASSRSRAELRAEAVQAARTRIVHELF